MFVQIIHFLLAVARCTTDYLIKVINVWYFRLLILIKLSILI